MLVSLMTAAVIGSVAIGKLISLARNGENTNTRPTPIPFNGTESGPIVYLATNPHHVKDNMFKFNYKKVGAGWRAYILRMPSLNGRSDSAHIIHRLGNAATGYYICWDSTVTSLSDMQNISRAWADNILEYIRTGRRFG